jgi:hypothetical protein
LNLVLDILFLRKPKIDYLSPAICEAIFSGSSFPIIILNDIGKLPGPSGLVIGGVGHNQFSWNAYPGALCYNIYSAVFDVTDITACEQLVDEKVTVTYEIIQECYSATSFVIPHQGCYRISAITPDGESDLSDPICSCDFSPPPMVHVCNDSQTANCPEGQTGAPVTIPAGTYCQDVSPDQAAATKTALNNEAFAQAVSELSCQGTGCDGPNWDSMSWVEDFTVNQGTPCTGGTNVGLATISPVGGAIVHIDAAIPGDCDQTAPGNAGSQWHGDLFYTGPGGNSKLVVDIQSGVTVHGFTVCVVRVLQDGNPLATWDPVANLADETLGLHTFNFAVLGGIASNIHVDVEIIGNADNGGGIDPPGPQQITAVATLSNVC